jgi:hypothetical protein
LKNPLEYPHWSDSELPPQSKSVQAENIVDILESKKKFGYLLAFTSTRIIILKNPNRAIHRVAETLFAISFLIGIYIFGLVVGVTAFIIGATFTAIYYFKANKTIKVYRKTPIEGLLRMKHEEINYSQVEKVVFWWERKLFGGEFVQHLDFSYIISGRGKKEKRFEIDGTMYHANLEMLDTVLCGKVTGNLDTLSKELRINRAADSVDNKNSCAFCIHDLSKACPYPKLNVDASFRKNKRCESYEYNTKIKSP